MSQQGWQPGQFLGAENANHSDHYTAANASHIRIALREDNLGLGAKVGGNKAETFGLSLFSGVLGRLNGKDDAQVQKQQDALRDAELRQYQVGKYGLMNFVSGGLLVGDKMEEIGEKLPGRVQETEGSAESAKKRGKKRALDERQGSYHKSEKRKKRRRSEDEDEDSVVDTAKSDDAALQEKARRKEKRSKKSNETAEQQDVEVASTAVSDDKKAKKRNRKADSAEDPPEKSPADEKARLKEEKRARKEDRRRRKEEKRLKKAKREASKAGTSEHETKLVQAVHGGRHAVRHRYIQQKRMAGMDAQAMKEIFMVKAAA